MDYEKKNNSVSTLVNKLCHKFAARKSKRTLSDHDLSFEKKLKTRFFEIILSKSDLPLPTETAEPIEQLLTYYFIANINKKNVIEFENAKKLKEVIDYIMGSREKNEPTFCEVLRLLICLKDTSTIQINQNLYQNPFTFGKMEEMLPRPPVEAFGSSCPYMYFPSYLFEHPNRNQALLQDKNILNNFVHNHDAYEENANSNRVNSANSLFIRELRGNVTPHDQISFFHLPTWGFNSSCNESWNTIQRLTQPRDLLIPHSGDLGHNKKNFFTHNGFDDQNDEKIPSFEEISIEKQYKSCSTIWDVARSLDTVNTHELWELAATEPKVSERRLISMASQQVALWKEKYADRLHEFVVISERKFIRHLMYLSIGIESSSFYMNKNNVFVMRLGLVLEGISSENLQNYVSNLLIIGTCYWRLNNFAMGRVNTDLLRKGFIYKVCENNVREFLVSFRVRVTSIFGDGDVGMCEVDTNKGSEPTLLQIVQYMRPLKQQIETIAALHKVIDTDPEGSFPHGAGLMAYLYKEISMVTQANVARVLFASLKSICQVYFKFIERFIFEGELEDPHLEFFIQKDPAFAHVLSKRYWDRGFFIHDKNLVPTFLKGLAEDILLCGKSLRLLKQCNPNDPLCVLLSSEHPSLSCCTGFAEVSRQRRVLEVYRTRCRFVCGEPITFDAIALRKEAERKAFTEKASIKQAETMEKIVAERKRLAQLIAEEKQNSLRILEAALAADKLRKRRRGPRDQTDTPDSSQALDAHIKDEEEKKILEYYSKLNEQVEKRKQHSDWKLKRLQLHESRVQMLSSEERHLRCQKLELQYSGIDQQTITSKDVNRELCERSSNADVNITDEETLPTDVDMENSNEDNANNEQNMDPQILIETDSNEHLNKDNKMSTDENTTTNIFNVIFRAAKNIFSHDHSESVVHVFPDTSENQTDGKIDINKNPVSENTVADCVNHTYLPDLNSNEYTQSVTSRSVSADQKKQEELNFQSRKVEALANKQKVLLNEFAMPSDKDNIHTWKREAFDTNKERNVGSSVDFTVCENKNNFEIRPPVTLAQKEALENRNNILFNEFNETTETRIHNWKREEFDANKDRNEISLVTFTANKNENKAQPRVPVNEAQREAIENKQKVLLNEFNEPTKSHIHTWKPEEFDANKDRNEISLVNSTVSKNENKAQPRVPVNEAQREAIKNKQKVLLNEFNEPMKSHIHTWKPEEFDANKDRNEISLVNSTVSKNENKAQPRVSVNEAQREAIKNKQKVLLNEFNEPMKSHIHTWKPEEFDANKDRNEISLVNSTVSKNENKAQPRVPVTETQKEAVENKQKVFLTEFNTPADIVHSPTRKSEAFDTNKERNEVSSVQFSSSECVTQLKCNEPVTDAQTLALKNKERVLGSDYGIRLENMAKENTRKRCLTLDLRIETAGSGKKTEDWRNIATAADLNISSAFTPAVPTPGHLATMLNFETPTSDILLPPSSSEEPFSSHVNLFNGFNFSESSEEHENMFQTEPDIICQTPIERETQKSNLLKAEGYCFDNFDPFGVKGAALQAKDHFSKRMFSIQENFLYGNGEDIVEMAQCKPMWDIFKGSSVPLEEVSDSEHIDLMTLRACLQRSVMLPLSYQLEMVNNSILTYFLNTLDLYEHLKSLKDYFFLMDGEFSRTICNSLFKKLASVRKADELLNFETLHNLLNRAVSSSISSSGKYSENLSFTVKELPVYLQHRSPDVLQCLVLSYSVTWPMNIILSNEALERYSMVFQFLLKLRRISWVLAQDFEILKITLKRSNESRIIIKSPEYRSIQLFRHSMASLIRALDSYLVTSCILATWTEFEQALKRARTLQDLYNCHVAYVKEILFRCLLNKRSESIMALLNDIFTVILRFHEILHAKSWEVESSTGLYRHPNFGYLRELFLLLDKLCRRLHKTVAQLMEYGYQPHLAQLITTINLNDFYNKPS